MPGDSVCSEATLRKSLFLVLGENIGPEAPQSPYGMSGLWKTAGGASFNRTQVLSRAPTCSCPWFSSPGHQAGVDPMDKRPNGPLREQNTSSKPGC